MSPLSIFCIAGQLAEMLCCSCTSQVVNLLFRSKLEFEVQILYSSTGCDALTLSHWVIFYGLLPRSLRLCQWDRLTVPLRSTERDRERERAPKEYRPPRGWSCNALTALGIMLVATHYLVQVSGAIMRRHCENRYARTGDVLFSNVKQTSASHRNYISN